MHLAGEIPAELLGELRALADVAPYDGGDGQEAVLADGGGGTALLSDLSRLTHALEAGRQVAVVHPRPEQTALLQRVTGTSVDAAEVDLVSYLRLPGPHRTLRPPCHLSVVPRRRQTPGAAGARPFGARDVVEALTAQRARVEAGGFSPLPGMFPPDNDQAYCGYTALSVTPVFDTLKFPSYLGHGDSQTWQISLEGYVFWYYVNGDPALSPYYLVVVMLYPSFQTGAGVPWNGVGNPGPGFTPYIMQAAGASLRSWSAGGGGSSLPLASVTLSPGAPAAVTAPPPARGEPQSVTAALGNGAGLTVPMFSTLPGSGWTVPQWETSAAAQVMNLTADLGITPGTGPQGGPWTPGWLFQTEWLYHKAEPSSFVAGTFVPPSSVPGVWVTDSSHGSVTSLPLLANWPWFFSSMYLPNAPYTSPATTYPFFGPATLDGITRQQNNLALYAVTMVGPNLSPTGGGWVNPQQYFPPPSASLSFQPQLYEVLTCFGDTLANVPLGVFFWTAQATADFPRVSVTLDSGG
jgi:hypothetical protein